MTTSLSQLRHILHQQYHRDEETCLKTLIEAAQLPLSLREKIKTRAVHLVEAVRAKRLKQGGVDAFLKEYDLSKKLNYFPEILKKSSDNYDPSLLANYSLELAHLFNKLYQESKVIGSEKEEFLLCVVYSFRYVLKNSLNLLNIDILEEM